MTPTKYQRWWMGLMNKGWLLQIRPFYPWIQYVLHEGNDTRFYVIRRNSVESAINNDWLDEMSNFTPAGRRALEG